VGGSLAKLVVLKLIVRSKGCDTRVEMANILRPRVLSGTTDLALSA
jgi:hypothetical protein